MKAAVIREYGPSSVLSIEEVEKPVAEKNLVLIEVYAASVNPIDWKIRNGEMVERYGTEFPKILGADLAGVVVDVGPDVLIFKPGDEVYARSDQMPGAAYAEFAVVGEGAVALKPKSASFIEAAAMPLVCITALQGLRDCAQIQPGQRLLIVGASGGVGTYAIQLAKQMGAHVTAVCSGRNFSLVTELGADAVIDYRTTDALETDEQYDVIYDVVGSHTLTAAKRALKDTAIYMTLVPVEPDIEFFFPGRTNRKAGHGYFVITTANTIDLTDLAERFDSGRLRTVIDSVYPLEKIRMAHERSQTLRARGKIVLTMKD